MLKALRKHAKYFYVLFFIVILTFIFWGVGTVDRTDEREFIAEVGKYKISAEEYWRTYDNAYRFYREIYKDRFDGEMEKELNLKENVLESMINEKVLLIAAKEIGLNVSDEELQESISREPAFTRNGVFSEEIYLNRLRLSRITPETYERAKRQELILMKMSRLVELSVDVSDIDFKLPQNTENEQMIEMLGQVMLNNLKEKAVKSYVEGLKKQIKMKVNQELIS
ncbi:MAG: SurA N-terminal domain-containing protein [Nitrospirae bacterium]|nr:SurA N-terminal domain-containing protein [Nitrospirota bacterium]